MSQIPSSASLRSSDPKPSQHSSTSLSALQAPRPWYRRAWEQMLTGTLTTLSRAARLHPGLSYKRTGVERLTNVPYTDTGLDAHRLDVYRPVERSDGPLPALMYIHGGGFQLLSKETHWSLALRLAAQGFVVFNIEYRLAPAHRYPAAIQDAIAACLWVHSNAEDYGADASRLFLAGESAGANLATAVAVASAYEHTEPWARALWDTKVDIAGVLAGCGVLQVSDPDRHARRREMPEWLMRSLREVSDYLPNQTDAAPGEWLLADPLCLLERGQAPDKPLPPFFAFVGTKDPLLDDSRRLHRALQALGADSRIGYYPGGIHAFHALPWGPQSNRCWSDQFDFLKDCLHR